MEGGGGNKTFLDSLPPCLELVNATLLDKDNKSKKFKILDIFGITENLGFDKKNEKNLYSGHKASPPNHLKWRRGGGLGPFTPMYLTIIFKP